MIDLSRRSFLGGVLAVTAAMSIPIVRATPARPILWADGVHDDTEALNAILSNTGLAVDVAYDNVRLTTGGFRMLDGTTIRSLVHLSGGLFRVTGPIVMGDWTHLSGCHIICDGPSCAIEIGRVRHVAVENNYIDGQQPFALKA